MRMTVLQIRRIDEREHFLHALGALFPVEAGESITNIGGDAHMRKERRLLCDQCGLAMTRLQVNAAYGITQHVAIECNVASIWQIETGEITQKCAFACTGWSKNHCPLGSEVTVHLKMEAATTHFKGELKHGDLCASDCRCRWLPMPRR